MNHMKKHEYLGMQMDYGVPSEVSISMEDYIRLVLQEAPEDMGARQQCLRAHASSG